MAQDLKTKIIISSDTKEAETNVGRLEVAFRGLLKEAGKKPDDIAAIVKIAHDAADGKVAVDSLDGEMRQLVGTYSELFKVAAARDKLNLIPHEKIKQEIDGVRKAYGDLKVSGQLTHAELAQAAIRMQQEIAELNAKTNGWVEALGHVKGSLATLAASATGLTAAANQAIEFESAMANVSKVMDATPEQMAALTSEIKEMATQIPIGVDGLAAIAAQAGQLGIASKDVREFTELVAQMATAFDMAPEAAATSIATLKTVFGLGIEEVRALGDAINVLGNNTSARERDIIDVMARIGGSAKQFGLATEQAAALSAAMLSLGKSPEVASTGINALLSKLQTAGIAGADFQEALGRIGLSGEQLAASVRDNPQKALTDFLGTLQGLERQTRAEVIGKLFGLEYQDDIAALVGSLDAYGKALGLAGDKQASAGAMQDEFAKRTETTKAQLEILANTVEVAAINLGEAFLPAVNMVASGLATAAKGIADFVAAFPNISAAAAIIGTVAGSVGALRILFSALHLTGAKALEQLTFAAKLLGLEIDATSVAIGRLSGAFKLATAFMVGWEVGEALSKQFAIVRQAGVAMVEGLVQGAEYVRYGWELAKAVITSDTIDQASARHQARLAEMRDIFDQMYLDAEKAPQKAADAANSSAESTAQANQQIAQSVAATSAAIAQVGDEQAKALDKVTSKTDVLAQATRALGIDVELYRSGMKSAEVAAVSSLDVIVEHIESLGLSAEKSSELLRDSLIAAINDAATSNALATLEQRLGDLYSKGSLGAGDYTRALKEVNDKHVEINKSAKEGADRLMDFGKKGKSASKDITDGMDAISDTTQQVTRDFDWQSKAWKKSNAEFLDEVAAGASVVSKVYNDAVRSIKESIGSLSKSAVQEFDRMMLSAQIHSFDALDEAMKRSRDYVLRNVKEQKNALQELMEKLADTGNLTVGMINGAQRAAAAFDLLDKVDLDNLQNSIARAQQQMDSLRKSASDTLGSLRDEVDRLKGNEAAIQEREFRRRYAELSDKLKEAQKARDQQSIADLKESIRLLQEKFKLESGRDVTVQTTRKDGGAFVGPKDSTDINFSPGQANKPTSQAAQPAATPSPVKTINLNIDVGGRTMSLPVLDSHEADVERFIAVLAEHGMRAN